jgi:hypothetical protein
LAAERIPADFLEEAGVLGAECTPGRGTVKQRLDLPSPDALWMPIWEPPKVTP